MNHPHLKPREIEENKNHPLKEPREIEIVLWESKCRKIETRG
jgi:hypothetical protein